MKIYLPIKNSYVFQKYGAENTYPSVMPWYKELELRGHSGYDFTAKDGDKIYYDCDIDGTVIGITTDLNAGYGIEILTESEKGIFKHRYWHLRTDGILVKVGQKVKLGDLIGLADNTGKYTTGTHLHRDLKQCIRYSNGVLETINRTNGYLGAIDLAPYYQPIFVLNIAQQITILQKMIELYKKAISLLTKDL